MTTEEKTALVERCKTISTWREKYGESANVMLPAAEAERLARIALAVLTAEPVGYVSNVSRKLANDGRLGYISNHIVAGLEGGYVYDLPPLPTLPEGWRLVPVEPTQEMVDAHINGVASGGFQRGYRAMLAAAPTP